MGENKEKICIVVDTNILIAELINPSSAVLSILEVKDVDFFVPEFFLSEFSEYKDLIKEKLDKKEKLELFNFLISELFRNIVIIPEEMYSDTLPIAVEIMRIDEKDSPFLALAMKLNCPLWSNDRHFRQQKEVKTYTTEELVEMFIKELP